MTPEELEKKRATDRRRYVANRDKKLKKNRAWRDRNIESVKATEKAWRDKNRDDDLARKKEWRDKNPIRQAVLSYFSEQGLSIYEVPESLIELKSKHILLLRGIRKAKEATKNG